MDFVTQTSLEALLLKATNSNNENIDTAAVEAFCALINKEKDGPHMGVKVLANRLTCCGDEKEMLQTLNVLDTCMARCGSQFQTEVGKFRFLNEMIKLVSPKYLGQHTPISVKQKVLQLMYIWTLDYPREMKIKEAYDMLRKQGVIREIPNPNSMLMMTATKSRGSHSDSSIFHDEEKSKILQKLLQSKDPEDIQAANWLIKSMVKEDDKRAELKSRRISELESVQNNVQLLNEMLDSYKPGISSRDELDLIQELYQSCERLRPNIIKLAEEFQLKAGEEILGDVLKASDELNQVFGKFHHVIDVKNKTTTMLLDVDGAEVVEGAACVKNGTHKEEDKFDVLCDIFNTTKTINQQVLQPTAISPKSGRADEDVGSTDKYKILDDLDVLSEHLLKQNLLPSKSASFINNNKNQDKVPMNLLLKLSQDSKPSPLSSTSPAGNQDDKLFNFDLGYFNQDKSTHNPINNGDDVFLVDITDEKMLETSEDTVASSKSSDLKLNDISIELSDIKASPLPPLSILNDEKSGLLINLHAAKDQPRPGVRVYVVTTVSKNELAISNYLFQAVVPKNCKLRLLEASGRDFPPYNPFLPPAAITQILLIACPQDCAEIVLKFIISYVLDDETCTEMGQVDLSPTLV